MGEKEYSNLLAMLIFLKIQNDLILRALYDDENFEKANKIINDTLEKIINED